MPEVKLTKSESRGEGLAE